MNIYCCVEGEKGKRMFENIESKIDRRLKVNEMVNMCRYEYKLEFY